MPSMLIAVDGSDPSLKALEYGCRLAKKTGAQVLLLNVAAPVVTPPGIEPGVLTTVEHAVRADAERVLLEAQQKAHELDVVAERRLEFGDPGHTISDVAEAVAADPVVVGSHGRTGVKRLLLGSVADKVVRLCPRPVLVVH